MQNDTKHKPTFYIVIPAYNAKDTICQAIESAVNQEQNDQFQHQIIVVDDGSTDTTKQTVLDNFINNNNVELIYTEHKGAVGARKTAIARAVTLASVGEAQQSTIKQMHVEQEYVEHEHAHEQATGYHDCIGEAQKKPIRDDTYFVFLDADDKLTSDALQHYTSIIKKHNAPDFIISNFYHWKSAAPQNDIQPAKYPFELGHFSQQQKQEKLFPWIFQMKHAIGFCRIVAKVALVKKHYPNTTGLIIGEDRLLSQALLWNAKSLYFTDKPTYYYNQFNKQSLTHTTALDPTQLLAFKKAEMQILKDAEEEIINQSFNFIFYNLVKFIYEYSCGQSCLYIDTDSNKNQKRTHKNTDEQTKIAAEKYDKNFKQDADELLALLKINQNLPKAKQIGSAALIKKLQKNTTYNAMKNIQKLVKMQVIKF